jgi:polyhydroxybutyrate depolymerase
LAIVLAACGDDATGPDGDGVLGEWVRSAGVQRTYELRVPPSYVEGRPTPLLLAFHGNPDTGAGFEARSGLTPAAAEAGFITAYPDGIEGTWGTEDVLLVHDLIRHLADHLSVDRDRVYAAGFSAGGTITQLFACSLADELAAAVSVGATLESDIADGCRPAREIPILFVHGTDDQVFPWEGRSIGSLERLSVEATLDRWKQLNRCFGEADAIWLPDLVDDGTRAWTEQWTDCQRDAEVMLYGLEGGGHTWPSGPGPFPPGLVTQEISSAEIIEFLERHTLR